jgi:hypothetical protein
VIGRRCLSIRMIWTFFGRTVPTYTVYYLLQTQLSVDVDVVFYTPTAELSPVNYAYKRNGASIEQ